MPPSFDSVVRIIERAVASRACPAAAIEVGSAAHVLWRGAFGRLTYAPDAPAATMETVFDLASLTKVIATATLAMRAIDAGTLRLEDRVGDRLPEWRGDDRAAATVQDLLEHASGLTAYLPFFRDHDGRAEFQRAICTLPLEYAPRTQSVYSDLGFILLGFILEDLGGAPLAEQFDGVFRLNPEAARADDATPAMRFNPPREWRARTAPTELDTWRGRLLQGEVHDENTWVLGGAAGHAGLFGTAPSVGAFAQAILSGLRSVTTAPTSQGSPAATLAPDSPATPVAQGPPAAPVAQGSAAEPVAQGPPAATVAQGFSPARDTSTRQGLRYGNVETLRRFVQRSTVPGSSRALGWDTMLPSSSCGTRLSPRAIGHTGFTGTSLWIDPDLDLYVVLLTNRVHPTRENNQISAVRRQVHDSVVDAMTPDVQRPTNKER